MDCRKDIYSSGDVWFGKVTTQEFGSYDLSLFIKYYQPSFDVGGSFTDGTTAFSLASVNKRIKDDSFFAQAFDPTAGGFSRSEANKRAIVWSNVIVDRIATAMDTLRAIDGTANSYTSFEVI